MARGLLSDDILWDVQMSFINVASPERGGRKGRAEQAFFACIEEKVQDIGNLGELL